MLRMQENREHHLQANVVGIASALTFKAQQIFKLYSLHQAFK